MDTTNDLDDFVLGDMIRLAASLRVLAADAVSVEDYAGRVCRRLHEIFVGGARDRQTVLARLYLTQPFSVLPEPEREFAATGTHEPDGLRCLTLLGTAGESPAWNVRRSSAGHLAIALHDADRVAAMPMVSGLLAQMGVNVRTLLDPAELVTDSAEHRYGVFHVPQAPGSPLIPAQDFVATYGVRSVLGFGGMLPDGEIYAVVMFLRATVSRPVAELFETLAPSVTLAMVDLMDVPVFTDGDRHHEPLRGEARSDAQKSLLRSLLEVHERVAADESDRARAEARRTQLALAEAEEQATKSGQLARTLQSSLLPHELPKISGLQAAAFFRPAGDGSEIGGDFYDLFPVRRGTWGLVLGDVSGKGAGAASLTALARHSVRAVALRTRSSVEVLRVLNHTIVLDDSTEDRYLTAMFAFLTREGPVLDVEMCLAGHEHPLLLRSDGLIEEVGTPGQPLGLFRQPELEATHLAMRTGDRLIAYTDGVIDARRGSERFGTDRLKAVLGRHANQHIDDCIGALAAVIDEFQGDRAADDIAIVGIHSTR